MKCFVAAAVLLAATCGAPVAAQSQSRLALVIGNAAYAAPDVLLKNTVTDARLVADTLTQLGFRVRLLENADHATMRRSIREVEDDLRREKGVGFFYFAGHGVQIAGRNYLMPVGAGVLRENDVLERTIDANELVERLRSTGSTLTIVVLDACRDNPLYKPAFAMRGGGAGLAPLPPASGTLVAFATEPGRVASDGTGGRGVYAKHLVQYMRVPGLPLEQVFKRVRESVRAETDGAQVPVEFSMLTGGDFYFVPR